MILGGGRREFRTNATLDEDGNRGKRTDGLNLIQNWESDKQPLNVNYNYVSNREELLNLDPKTAEYTLGE